MKDDDDDDDDNDEEEVLSKRIKDEKNKEKKTREWRGGRMIKMNQRSWVLRLEKHTHSKRILNTLNSVMWRIAGGNNDDDP